jgi:crotonobetainyl-CoA:carnitine CoA-transferase CaiB-like acyl-CoA transferase
MELPPSEGDRCGGERKNSLKLPIQHFDLNSGKRQESFIGLDRMGQSKPRKGKLKDHSKGERTLGQGLLSTSRVLDLTDEKGFLCGKILADLGADVIKIEPPGGSPSRKMGPFYHDLSDPEKSLYWFCYNSNKRGITLNIETRNGKEIFKRLVKDSDVVIESYDPGYLDKIGLGYSKLQKINNGIILTSITPFGQTGPYQGYKGTDIVAMAMSGILYQTGDPDLPPVNISIPQSYLHAGGDAAVASLIAYYFRERTGVGQHVDISLQQSTALYLANTIPLWELEGEILTRAGQFRKGLSPGAVQRQIWPCKDGYVFFVMLGGATGAKTCRELVRWMDTEGMANEYLRGIEWENWDMAERTQQEIDEISTPVEKFFLSHTKMELWEGAVRRHMSVCPFYDPEDLIKDPQLRARNFWVEVDHPELGTHLTYPREFVKTSREISHPPFRAPLIGEHNNEVYGALGFSLEEMTALKEDGVI